MKGEKVAGKRPWLMFIGGSILFALTLVASKRLVRLLIEEFRV